ncbi:aldose epimerase family protein [Oleidesulfovibrio alaskensis]|uniref:aldose epimerase family protein n=1 Tax=Oleidesulfovibrio alaskensis TaxID=58180 RepID=UPI000406B2BA|nr:aldose epimerase family protein [Oleidesulfovibrio alaskensis]
MLRNTNDMTVCITDYGARLVSVLWPQSKPPCSGSTGAPDSRRDVITGYDSPYMYMDDPYYMGAIIGRLANRTSGACFSLDGQRHCLKANDGPHHLHGGPHGLHSRMWQVQAGDYAENATIILRYASPHGEQGYPGTVQFTVSCTLTDSNTLRLTMHAQADVPTPVSLTAHPYFNLSGHPAGSLHGHRLTVHASRYLPCSAAQKTGYGIPAGHTAPVAGTALDFTTPRDLTQALRQTPQGFDHYAVLDAAASASEPQHPVLRHAATLHHVPTGRSMQVHTDQPGLQIYSANFIAPRTRGKYGTCYGPQTAICLEPHGFPDAVNNAHFPSCIIGPQAPYTQTTEYRFFTGQQA